jgi:hypothetical protein
MALLIIKPGKRVNFSDIIKKHPDMLPEATYEFIIKDIENEEDLVFIEIEKDGTEYVEPVRKLIDKPYRKGGLYALASKSGSTVEYQIRQLGKLMPAAEETEPVYVN